MALPFSLMASSIFYPPSTDHKPLSDHHKPCMFSHNQRISSVFSTLSWLLVALLLCSSPHLAWVHTSIPSSPQLTHLVCSGSSKPFHEKCQSIHPEFVIRSFFSWIITVWCIPSLYLCDVFHPSPCQNPLLGSFANSFILMGESDY